MNNKDIYSILLNWTKAQYRLKSNLYNNHNLIENIKSLEVSLKNYNINNLKIFHQSENYYTLTYILNNEPGIVQFETEQIEDIL